ncbi:MAG: SpoIIE family protein phosphatase [Xanthomonadales bacterium]|jgi:serine phosphatase RsbU (regulator of sigma subunit)|nr:SpoIIE family protein phosphatase [Xanthomonadales bacterium]
MDDDDELLTFPDDAEGEEQSGNGWRVLIVDDEPAMHHVTRLALSDLRFRDRGLSFLSAYSGAEAVRVLAAEPDVALILLDVVMETDDAGLRVIRQVREQLGNDQVRIVLRTGQPGQAPERDVVLAYDINDYKEKTELTAQKLATTVVSSLRAYQAIAEVAQLNRELEQKVRERTAALEQKAEQLRRSLEALEQGERAGRRVQFKLLPQSPKRFGDYQFSHLLQPSEFMSGDFVDYFPIAPGHVLFYIADVSGHGVASAFVTVYLKRFLSAAHEAWLGGHGPPLDDPARLLASLNLELLREGIGKHVAIFVGVLDTLGSVLTYANGGAFPYPLLRDADGARYLSQRSTPTGLLPTARYENIELHLPPRCRLLLASDGVLELLGNGHEHALGTLRDGLQADEQSARSVAERLGCLGHAAPPDDVTLLLLAHDPAA